MNTNKIHKLLITITIFSLSLLFPQSDYEKYLEKDKKKFEEYEKSVTEKYKQFEDEEKIALEKFEQEVKEKWEEFKFPRKKEYVKYDKNMGSRTSVDFENGNVTVEILLEEDENNAEKAQQKLQQAMEDIINTKGDDEVPLLQDQLESPQGVVVTSDNVEDIMQELMPQDKVEIEKNHEGTDEIKRTKYSIVIPFQDNHLTTRAKRYGDLVLKYSNKYKVDPAIVFAIMETESSFNPKAKSHIPAYGLMQLVPSSGARDAYAYIHNKDKYLSKEYLYKPENNIQLGCAYLAKNRYVYFEDIKNDEKAYFCSIAAYNTGPGNVRKTLKHITGTNENDDAFESTNKMANKNLYEKLVTKLEYGEARDYLQLVWGRKDKYKG